MIVYDYTTEIPVSLSKTIFYNHLIGPNERVPIDVVIIRIENVADYRNPGTVR